MFEFKTLKQIVKKQEKIKKVEKNYPFNINYKTCKKINPSNKSQ